MFPNFFVGGKRMLGDVTRAKAIFDKGEDLRSCWGVKTPESD